MDPQFIDLATKLAGLGTAVVGLLLALAKAIGAIGKSNDVLTAIGKCNLSEEEKKLATSAVSNARVPWIALGAVSLFVFAFGVWNLTTTYTKESFSRSLVKQDPQLFRYSKTGLYDVARVFPDKQSIEDNSALEEVLKNAKHDFSLFSDHASSVVDRFKDDLIAALKRGVSVRVVLLHPECLDNGDMDPILTMMDRDKDLLANKLRITCETLCDWQDLVASDADTYRGSIEIRLLKAPVIHRMWIRDANDENHAIAHISVLQYRGRMTPPSFRTTPKSCTTLVRDLSSEFDELWNRAEEIDRSVFAHP